MSMGFWLFSHKWQFKGTYRLNFHINRLRFTNLFGKDEHCFQKDFRFHHFWRLIIILIIGVIKTVSKSKKLLMSASLLAIWDILHFHLTRTHFSVLSLTLTSHALSGFFQRVVSINNPAKCNASRVNENLSSVKESPKNFISPCC